MEQTDKPLYSLTEDEFFSRIEQILRKGLSAQNDGELLSVKQVAELFGTSVYSIHNSIKRGTMKPDHRKGVKYYFRKSSLKVS